MPLLEARALAIRETLHRLVLVTRADDRSFRAVEVIERLTALGATVQISETQVSVRFLGEPVMDAAVERHAYSEWLMAVQACMNIIIEGTWLGGHT